MSEEKLLKGIKQQRQSHDYERLGNLYDDTNKRFAEKYYYDEMKSAYYKLERELEDFSVVKDELEQLFDYKE